MFCTCDELDGSLSWLSPLFPRFLLPPTARMRKSTEFPKWVDDNVEKLKGKKVLMYGNFGIVLAISHTLF